MLMVAEALGGSNTSRVLDLQLNSNSDVTPGYVIYENGQPQRVLLINYMNDGGSGAATYTANIRIGGVSGLANTTPTTVTVRRLSAPSVGEKQNITWAGQSWGTQFMSDGRAQGNVVTETVNCAPDTGATFLPSHIKLSTLTDFAFTPERVSYHCTCARSSFGFHVANSTRRIV